MSRQHDIIATGMIGTSGEVGAHHELQFTVSFQWRRKQWQRQ